ncbi:MAG: LytTR family DNA-binding domain-containing protein [Bacteroidota bacterium]
MSKKHSVLIIDDEKLARESVLTLLYKSEDWEVIGECLNGKEAIQTILEKHPDLILIDIEMPHFNGLEVFETVTTKYTPQVIFITAYNEYAVKAFEINAVDYLLKPYTDGRFHEAMKRAKQRLDNASTMSMKDQILSALNSVYDTNKNSSYKTRFVVKSIGKIEFVEVDHILWVKAAGAYVELHTASGKVLMAGSISTIEKELPPSVFTRIHRSTIIRIDQIKSMEKYYNGEYLVLLKNGTQLKLSRSYKESVGRILGEF